MRKAINKKLRFDVFQRDNFTCQYCGRRAPKTVLHVDHVHPVIEGGTNDFENLTTSCIDCNIGKGGTPLSYEDSAESNRLLLDKISNWEYCFNCGVSLYENDAESTKTLEAGFNFYALKNIMINICFPCLDKGKAETINKRLEMLNWYMRQEPSA